MAVTFNGPKQYEISYDGRVNLAISDHIGVEMVPKGKREREV